MQGTTSLAATAAAILVSFGLSLGAHAADKEACASPYGPDDQIGAANRLTPQMAARAAKLVTTGKTYALSVETNSKTPAFGQRSVTVVINQPGQAGGASLGNNHATYNDDFLAAHMGIGTQIDGLGHAGQNHVYYNCNKGADFAQSGGLTKLGIEHIPPIVTRGVLLDMTKYYGQDPVPGGTAFSADDIEKAAKAEGVTIEEGDVVIFHTGWLDAHGTDAKAFLAAESGPNVDGAEYLAKKGVVAVGADNWGVEVSPNQPAGSAMPVHIVLLKDNGIYILEALNTGPLARDGVSEFMFVLGTPKITGLVQSIVTPVAIR